MISGLQGVLDGFRVYNRGGGQGSLATDGKTFSCFEGLEWGF